MIGPTVREALIATRAVLDLFSVIPLSSLC
jgi:hypothetical protein